MLLIVHYYSSFCYNAALIIYYWDSVKIVEEKVETTQITCTLNDIQAAALIYMGIDY